MVARILDGMTRLTNDEFAAAVGTDFTTASKLRNGSRLPSMKVAADIWRVYELDGNELFTAYLEGPVVFAAYLRSKVFEPQGEDRESSVSDD